MNKPAKTKQFTVAITNTTETTVLAAITNTFVDLASIKFSNKSATGVTVTVRDTTGGTAVDTWYVPATSSTGISYPVPFEAQLAGKNWTVQSSDAITTLYVTVQGVIRD